ncbi:MarR family transcriptional regulator [Pontibacter sp. G13]|uniref:MarR family winged helix-turn-helix transcriptional regulator n=1 Tax=Pontibacter sp. G13 TaxID=3074898 RepID=UPI0028896748|nr:MarR family transcriptional regulator [Pontibacter sp. G13]WNJ17665.1 MarR family transcriptional regulator [Pontibacter sp. G13]
MRLREAIQQKRFPSAQFEAAANVVYTGNWLVDQSMAIFKQHDMNEQHYNILRILRGSHPKTLSPSEIRNVMLNKRGDMTRLVDKLVKRGWVERSPCADNRRKVNLEITKAGLQMVEQLEVPLQSLNTIYERLTPEEAATLSQLLDKLKIEPKHSDSV